MFSGKFLSYVSTIMLTRVLMRDVWIKALIIEKLGGKCILFHVKDIFYKNYICTRSYFVGVSDHTQKVLLIASLVILNM